MFASQSGCGFDLHHLNSSEPEISEFVRLNVPLSETPPVAMQSIGTVKSYSSFPEQQSIMHTDGEFDLAIGGRGFFQVDVNGTKAYTRDGSFSRNTDGDLILHRPASLITLLPLTHIPEHSTHITISRDGIVNCVADGEIINASKIVLFRFPNRHRLIEIHPNLYVESETSGAAQSGSPGDGGLVALHHRMLECGVQIPENVAFEAEQRVRYAGEREYDVLVPVDDE